ncbi:tyrosine-type recombinase/integrase [Actinomadura yumaensis]|uniref:tyrosine-type recombinase/integrase n=1 Tax=Actinomadura yumaensis TaxID=111807 RepID=UPI003606C282
MGRRCRAHLEPAPLGPAFLLRLGGRARPRLDHHRPGRTHRTTPRAPGPYARHRSAHHHRAAGPPRRAAARTLWRLAYESAARADEVLALNIEHLDLDNKRGRILGKGGTTRWIHWQSSTARLLPRLINGRTSGPLFLADRRPAPARMPADADLCPRTGRGRLSYERAEYLFKQSTKKHDRRKRGFTLHQLRHARLTHLAEDGWSAPMLMGLSGHANIRSLAIYTNVTAEAVGAALAKQDPARRPR